MKPLLGAMLRGSELVIVNRCDGIPDDKLTAYRRTIRAMSRESEIVLDMTFLGFMCKWPEAEDYKTKQWVKVRAKIGIEYQKDYHGEGPVLYAEHVERAEEIKDVVQF